MDAVSVTKDAPLIVQDPVNLAMIVDPHVVNHLSLAIDLVEELIDMLIGDILLLSEATITINLS